MIKVENRKGTQEYILRVLFVDDDVDLLFGMITILRRISNNFIFRKAENGLDAIKMINDSPYPFQLIFSDISMPKISGYELVKYIKSNNIPSDIIAVTGSNKSDQDFLDAGFNRVLRKSSNLIDTINEIYGILKAYEIIESITNH